MILKKLGHSWGANRWKNIDKKIAIEEYRYKDTDINILKPGPMPTTKKTPPNRQGSAALVCGATRIPPLLNSVGVGVDIWMLTSQPIANPLISANQL